MNGVYNIPLALRLHGEVNEAALVRSLEELHRRHEALRTRFERRNAGAVQVIDPPGLALKVEGVTAAQTTAICRAECHYPFDLWKEQLCRIRLLRETDTESRDYLLLVVMHHSVSDGWSVGIFFRELMSLYQAYTKGESSPLAPLPIRYADYARWQRRWLQGEVLEKQVSYWREQLKELPPLLTLPTDRPRPNEQTFRGSTERFALPAALTEKLQALSREHGVTLFMTLLSALAVMLGRYAGQRDVAVGTPIANRTRRETEGLIGFFVNTLVMRHDLNGDPRFVELLKRTREVALQAYAHQEIPFERLVEELNPQRSASHSPLFQVMFILQNAPFEAFELPGLVVRPLDAEVAAEDEDSAEEGMARFDLTLAVQESPTGLVGGLEYNTDLFDRSTIRRMLDHYARLLEAIGDAPLSRLSHLEMLSDEERHQQLVGWNATALSYPDDKCIHELFEQQAEQTPDRIAVVHESTEFTYGELNRRANGLAHRLIEQGVGPEARVGLCMRRSAEMVVGLLGILKAGGCYVPLDPNYPHKRLAYLIEDSGVDLIVSHRAAADSLDTTVKIMELEGANQISSNPITAVNPSNLAYVIYTSGSTGRPKGVGIAHRSAVSLLSWSAEQWPARDREGVLASTSICFDLSIYELFLPLTHGGQCLLVDSILGLREMAQRERVSLINTVPSAAKALLEKGGLPRSLRVMNLAGEPLKPELVDDLYESSTTNCVYDLYGPSESTTYSTYALRTANGRETIGRPVANTQAYVVDGDGDLLPSGVVGELHLGGIGLARGYLNRPGATAEKFIPNRFSDEPGERLYRTGDLTRWLPDGTLEYLGRVDHQVKVRGYRIELGEIQSVLLAHDGVRDAVVVAREDEFGNKRLAGYVVAEAGAQADEATLVNELRSRLQEQLPSYMSPSTLMVLPSLPLTANGKIDRKALPAPDGEAFARRRYEAPQGEIEPALAQLWQELLRIDRVGRHDNFFELGGHSLLAVTLIERMRQQGLRTDVRALFNSPSLMELASTVVHEGAVLAPANLIAADCERITPQLLPLVQLAQEQIDRIVERVPGGARNVQDIYPLAPLQEGILFHHRMSTEGDTYLLPVQVAFDTRQRLNQFLSALQAVIDRHDILRTAVHWEALSQPVQVVWRQARLAVEEVELSSGDAARELRERFDPRRYRLDIHEAPLQRAFVGFDRQRNRWLLLLLSHHLAFDHTALQIIFTEAQAHLLGEQDRLAAPVPFRQFVAQARMGVSAAEHEEFFRGMLGDIEEPTAPFGWLDVRGDGGAIVEAHVPVNDDVSKAIRRCARVAGVSAASLCHLAWAQVLARLTNREEIVFGTVLFGRMQGGEGVTQGVGLFINTLPLRLSIAGQGVREALQSTHERLGHLLRHEHASLALVQRCSAVPAESPLFTTLLNYRYASVSADSEQSHRGWEGMEMLYVEERSNYPLTLSVDDFGEGFGLTVQVREQVEPQRICELMHEALAGLVEALERSAQTPMRSIAASKFLDKTALLSEVERHRQLVEWNSTSRAYPNDKCIHELFEARAEQTPDLVHEGSDLTYGELNRRANQLAHQLIERGVGPEVRVGLCVQHSAARTIGILGILKAGGCYVPLDPELPALRLEYVIRDSGLEVIVSHQALDLEGTFECVSLDGDAAQAAATANPVTRVSPENLAYVIYTADGEPRGVLGDHRGRHLFAMFQSMGLLAETTRSPDQIGYGDVIGASVSAYVLGPDSELLPQGVTGELHLGGVGLSRGYLNRPGQTAERFIPHRFSSEPGERLYRTGDLARWLPDGTLEVVGPLTAKGKVAWQALPMPEETRDAEYAPPAGVTEELLAQLWGTVLDHARVSRHDNFFALGGHSLLATQLASRIREAFSAELPLRELFEHPTLSAQARAIERARGAGALVNISMEPIPRDQPLPLSYAQQRLWFLHQYMGPNAVYNMPLALRLDGKVNEAALVRSLKEVYRRHEALRTHFETRDGSAVQVIDPPELELEVEAVSAADAKAIAQAERCYCFDLSTERLCRIRLMLESESGDYVLLVTMHHSVSDGWSLGIFFRELVSLYRAYANGEDSPLAPLPIQYADYALWQRRWLQGDMLQQQLSYWREQLDGLPPLLTLPTDHPRPTEQTFRGSSEPFAVPASLVEKLQTLSREQGVTLYMTLLSAFAALLGRYSGQQDVAIGTPIANRTRQETEGLIGFFVNMLVMRHDLSGDPRFVELLKRTRAMALQAYAHQDIPFEQLVEELNPQRSLAYSPLFQVSFSLVNTPPADSVDVAELSMVAEDSAAGEGEGIARYDITFNVSLSETGISGAMEFNTDVFSRATIAGMLSHYARLLAAIVTAPEEQISRYEILDEQEKYRQLQAWNDRQLPFPADRCVHELFEEQAAKQPDAIAIVSEGQLLSYGELNRRANRVAHCLCEHGVGSEVRVGICMKRSPELAVGLLGILKAGGAYVPLDPEYPQSRLEYMLTQSGCRVVLNEQHLLTDLPLLSTMTVLPLDVESHEALFGTYSDANVAVEESGVSSTNLAYVIYTSGSTGRPKGNAIVHRNISRLVYNDFIDYAQARTILCSSSPSFDALTFELWGPLLHGGRCAMVGSTRGSFAELGRVLEQQRVDCVFMTTALFNRLIDASAESLKRLKYLMVGGEAASIGHFTQGLRELPDTVLSNIYGPTENTTFSSLCPLSEQYLADHCVVPIGRPIGNTQAYVLGPRGEVIPVGVVGELYLGGAGLARGYMGQAALTAQKFVPNPFSETPGERLYRTGDLVRYLPDGNIEFIGRVDLQVKVRGFRIELGEIESVLRGHEAVREAVVLAREDEQDTRTLVAYVVASEEGSDARELQLSLLEHLRGQLPDYMVPAALVLLDTLPLTVNKKVDVQALPAPDDSAYVRAAYQAPATAMESALAELWRENLGLDQVGTGDNYFAIGGDSIRSIALVAEAKRHGLKFSVKDLFSHPTIEALAGVIETLASGEQTSPAFEIAAFSLLTEAEKKYVGERYDPAEIEDAFPLSAVQQGMIYHSLARKDLATYQVHEIYQVREPWDAAVFEKALSNVVSRHAMLRTVFDLSGARPIQVVFKQGSADVEIVDIADVAETSEWIEQQRQQGIDLSSYPWKIRVHVLPNREFVLGMSVDHALWDGWSNAVFLNELLTTYSQYQQQGYVEALARPPSYQHFVALEQEAVSSQENVAYWRNKLDGARLPWWTGDLRERSVNFLHEVPEEASNELLALAATLGVQEKSVWHAIYLALLSLLDGSNDVVGAVVTHGRPEISGSENTLGVFLNSLPVRVNMTGMRWRDLVLAAEAELQALQGVRHFPLIEIQVQTGMSFSASMFNFVNFHAYQKNFTDRQLISHGGFAETNYPLTFQVQKFLDLQRYGIHLSLDPSVFDSDFRERIHGYVVAIVEQLRRHSSERIDKAALLGSSELTRLLATWNSTARSYPDDRCIHGLFEQQAEQTPDRIAVVHESTELTYGELNRRANGLAHRLIEQGVGPEVRVGLCMRRSAEMVVGLLGILKAGGCYVPLDPNYPRKRLEYLIEDSGVDLIVSHGAAAESLNTTVKIMELEGANQIDTNPDTAVSPANLAYVIYTSGSTGRPKGVGIAHRSAVSLLSWSAQQWPARDRESVVASTSICFDLSIYELFLPLTHGGQCLLVDSILGLREMAQRERVNLINTVPSAAKALLERGGLPQSLRVMNLAGEPLKPELVDELYESSAASCVYDLYGPSESTTYSTYALRSANGRETIGRPVANTQAYVVDGDGDLLPSGVVGELHLGGVGLARGYLNRPGATAEKFIPNRFGDKAGERLYRTGDLTRWLPDGTLEYLGRVDHQVKVRGYRIELGEIQSVLLAHEGVRDAVVVARDDGSGTKRLVGYVVAESSHADEAALVNELRSRLQEQLPGYMVPSTLMVLASMPLTANGKIDRKALPAPEASMSESAYVPPEGLTEELLAELWCVLLKRERVSRHDNFFDLGGHSLLVTQLASRIRDAFSTELPLRALFEHPTLSSQAHAVEQARGAGTPVEIPLEVVSREQPLPLSYAQQRLWFMHQYTGPSAIYNMPLALRLHGELNEAALVRSLEELQRRHESLRTRFESRDESVVQVIDPPGLELEVEAVSAAEAKAISNWERSYRFDLVRERLCRIRLLRETGSESADYVLLVTMHHSVSDGWSLGVFFREFVSLYRAYANGDDSPLAPLPIQYADYAQWQRRWLQGAVLKEQVSYWHEQLADLPPLLTLPTDHPRPADQTFRGRTERFALPLALTERLQALSREQGVTLYMTLLSAFAMLLSRYAGQQDVAVGTPIANRTRRETEGLIGFFVNTLVTRHDLRGDPRFIDLLKRTRAMALQAYAHQDVPFEQLVEELNPQRSVSHSPLFQVMFILQNAPFEALEVPGLEVRPLAAEGSEQDAQDGTARFDLTLSVQESASGLVGGLEYNIDLFERDTVRRMLDHYARLLEAIVAAPQSRLSRLQMLDSAELTKLLATWNATASAYPQDACIHELFEAQASLRPDGIALVHEARELTYGELNRRANNLAHRLIERGVGPEERVGLCMSRSAELVIGILGILKAGGCYVPLDPDYPRKRLDYLLDDAQIDIVVTESSVASRVSGPGRDLLLLTDSSETSDNLDSKQFGLHPDHPAYLIYTSASTGAPKGVLGLHRSIVNRVNWLARTLGVGAGEVLCQKTSVGFVDHVAEIFQALSAGVPLVIVAPSLLQSPQELLREMDARGVTQLTLVPSLLKTLLDAGHGEQARSLRSIYTSGEALHLSGLERFAECFPHARLFNIYGSTEMGADVTCQEVTVDRTGLWAPIGKAIDNTQAYILDADGQLAVSGAIGELHIGGVCLSRGYFQRAGLTAERFVPHPFSQEPGARMYRTGDLARWLPDGTLEYLGRADHQVKVRGFRIELGEIESVLLAHESVREAVVLARDDTGDKRLVAYVVPKSGEVALLDDLRGRLQEQLPAYMVPSAFVVLERLPRTSTGKLDRKALPAPEETAAGEYTPPEGVTEELLAELWSVLLKRERVGRHDNFFELGGHSLLATQLISRIRDAFATDLPVRKLFEHPTLSSQARAIERARGAGALVEIPLEVVSREQPLTLSYAQQRLWFLHQYMGPNAVYNVPLALRLRGAVNEAALLRSLEELQRRHETLRTRLVSRDDSVVQVIDPPQLALAVESVSALETQAIAHAERLYCFDLSHEPLCRIRLLREADDYVLLVTMHHSVSDGWSLGIFFRELMSLYRAYANGADSPLAPLPIQYADYAQWQRRWLQGAVLDEQVSYWREQLMGLPSLLSLPTDRPRPSEQTFRGHTEYFALPLALSDRLQRLSREQGVTLYMTLLSVFAVMLGRYAGQQDVAVGTPIANRTRQETEGLIGFFVNTLVTRHDLSGDPRFSDLLKRTRAMALQAYAHQDIPFEQLVEELNPQRSVSHSPLFQVMFILQNAPLEALELPGLEVQPLVANETEGAARFDLTLSMQESSSGLVGGFEYNTDLFERDTILRMLDHYTRLLESIVAAPQSRLSRLEMLGAGERDQQLVVWNATARAYPQEKCVHALFEARAEQTPDRIALVYEDRQLTYGELNRRANRLAHQLIERGVGPEVRVGLCMQRSAEMMIGLLGILKAGGCYVPLDPNHPQQRLAYALEDSGLTLVVGDAGQRQGCVSVEDDGKERSETNPSIHLPSSALAYVIYTSGSTGKPKGTRISHGNVVNFLLGMQETLGIGIQDRLLAVTTLSFDIALLELYLPLTIGATVDIAPADSVADGERLMKRLEQNQITLLQATPVTWKLLLDSGWQGLERLTALVGGEAFSRELATRLFGKVGRIWNMYGPTETTIWSTCWRVAQSVETSTVPIGHPIANTDVYVLDDYLQLAPAGTVGQLYLAGAGVSQGYLNRPGLTAERFLPHPFSRKFGERLYGTGDLARWLPDGTLECLGRVDHQVKVRGFRIELGEIESVLLAHESVRDAVVVARDDSSGTKQLVGYVVAEHGGQVDDVMLVNALRIHLQAQLPSYMVPSPLLVLSRLPLTANGKIDRKALPAPEASRSDSAYVSPEGLTEELLAELWCVLLKRERVSRHDNFFDLGGHSLLVTQLASRIREAFATELPLRVLFENPTLSSQARAVEQARGAGTLVEIPLEVVSREQPLPLSYAQQRLWFLNQFLGANAIYNIPLALRLLGDVNEAALVRSLEELQRRHESLRTRFESRDESAVQVIDPPGLEIEVEPVSAVDAQIIACSERVYCFDLANDRLCRIRLLREMDSESLDYVLLVTMHHSVSDGWSLGILFHELVSLYRAYANGEDSPLAPLPIQYVDYAQWQRRWLQGEVREQQLSYWREQLKELPPLLTLPTDHPRPAEQTFRGRMERFALPLALTERLQALSREQGVTLYMTLLSAFAMLLCRYAGQQDVAVGTPIANRTRRETEGLIGFFVNTLVTRHDLSGDPRFVDLLKRTRAMALQAYAHQDVPFEQLVEELNPQRSVSHSPLFQVMFILQNAPFEALEVPGLEVRAFAAEAEQDAQEGTARFDLTLSVQESASGLVGGLEYSIDLFERDTVRRMLDHYARLLEAIVAAPQSRLSRLEMLGSAELTRLLTTWNATAHAYPQEKCVHELFEAKASLRPDGIALVHEDRALTYGELNRRANNLAHRLIERGVGPEERVGLCMPRSPELVIGILGILKAGGCYVPLDPDYPRKRLDYLLDDAQIDIVVTEPSVASHVSGPGRDVLLLTKSSASETSENLDSKQFGLHPDHPAYLIYTSASTGAPKGVLGLHRSIVNRVNWLARALGVGTDEVLCQKTSVGFVDHVAEIFQALSAGVPLVIVAPSLLLSPQELLREMDARGVTQLTLVPSLLKALLDAGHGERARSLKSIYTSGEALHLSGLDRFAECFPHARLFNIYGSTEMGADVTCQEVTVDRPGLWAPIGKAIDNTQAYILDADGQLAVSGAVGELHIGGVCLSRGYFQRAGLTAERFIPHPFSQEPGARVYRTGDLARWLPDGTLEYLGRADHQVKVRGFRIELGEIESALLAHESVREAVVLARDDTGDKRLVAYVVPKSGEVALTDDLRSHLQEQLPAYMMPSAFVLLDSLPRTSTGKLDRKALPAPEETAAGEYTPPEGVTEELLAELWSVLLKRERVGRHDNFFELGGHSLLATQLLARIRTRFLVELPIRDLFDKRTLQQQALAIETHREANASRANVHVSDLYRQLEKTRKALVVAGEALEAGEI